MLDSVLTRTILIGAAVVSVTAVISAQEQPPAETKPQAIRKPFADSSRISANDIDPEIAAKVPPLRMITGHFVDLGYVKPRSFPTQLIGLINNGDRTLTIRSIKGDCSCIEPTLVNDKQQVGPGDSIEIIVGVEMPLVLGDFSRQVQIEMEGYEEPFRIPVYAEVGWAVRINGGGMFAVVPDRKGRFRLDAVDSRPFRVLAVQGRPPKYVGFDPITDEPRTEYQIEYDFSSASPAELPRWVVIETDHPEARMIDMPAMIPGGQVIIDKQKWHVYEERLLIERVEPGSPVITTMTLTGRAFKPGETINMRSSNKDIGLQITGVRRPEHINGLGVDLKIQPGAGLSGWLHSVLTVEMGGEATAVDLFIRVGDP